MKPAQRLILLDMLYSGPADRRLQAGRLIWNAYIEYNEQLRTRYGELARNLGDEAWEETAGNFAAARIATEISVRNGFGVPVLLTEVKLSPNPLHDVRFSAAAAPSLGWASSGAVGVWEVIPGVQTGRMFLDAPRQAPVFPADEASWSSYLFVDEHSFGISYRDPQQPGDGWGSGGATLLAACYCGDLLAVGLSAGAVAFIDPGEARVTEIMPLAREDQEEQEEDLTSMRLWPAADGRAAVFDGDDFYLVQPGHDATGESSAVQMDIQHPSESARLLAASGPRIIWGLSADELLIAGTSEPGPGVKLTAHYSTDEGFTAAAMSSDGTVIAAICDSFLHVWRSMAAGSDYEYLTMTPQQGGRCVDVSADGRYITVGTRAGSACIYLTRPIEEE